MTKSKTFRFNNIEQEMLLDLANKYDTTQTDILTSLLEISWNILINPHNPLNKDNLTVNIPNPNTNFEDYCDYLFHEQLKNYIESCTWNRK